MGMDVEYLKKSVGKCLADGLAEIADRQPVDPINFLAHWIHNYKKKINQEEKRKVQRTWLECENEEAYAGLEEAEGLKAEVHLLAQKSEKQLKNRAKEQDVKMPEEYEAILKEEVLEDNQGELNTVRNKLDVIRDEVTSSATLPDALTKITLSEDLDRISKEISDNREESESEHSKLTRGKSDVQIEGDR